MICYFDTSALVPLLIEEPGTAQCERLWNTSESVVTCRLLFAEAAAALAQAERMGRIDGADYSASMARLGELWDAVNVVEVDDELVRRAGTLAREHGLRGYDAVHCASAERLRGPELVVATGDHRFLEACRALGFATSDTSAIA